MALPVTISSGQVVGADQNSYLGPFKSSGGNYYTLLNGLGTGTSPSNSELGAFKATDPTSSFTQQDDTNQPTFQSNFKSINIHQDGDDLHAAVQRQNVGVSAELWYARFDMSLDAWANIDGAGDRDIQIDGAPNGTADACDIAVLSASYGVGSAFVKIRVVYQGQTDMDMGSSFERIDESNSVDDGVNWSAPTSIDSATGGAGVHYTGPRIVKHPSDDQCFIFFSDGTNVIQRAIAGDDTLRTYRVTTVDVTQNDYPFGHAIGFTRASTDVIRVPYYEITTGDLEILEFDAFTDDTDRTETNSNVHDDAARVINNSLIACIAVDGSTIRGLYAKVSGADLFEFDDDDSDTYTLQSTAHVTGTVNHISCNVYDRSGTKLAMIYDDGGTVKYDEVAITTTIAVLSGVDMAQQNMFHGPFEI